jgi:HSP20 family molecular chaperone IbpA
MSEEKALQIEETEKREVAETGAERTREGAVFVPRTDVYETNEAIFVVAEMPGANENSVDIMLEQDVLTINGSVEPAFPEGYELEVAEYRVGDYTRAFTLTDQVDRDAIEATVRDGVLRLRLPKVTKAQIRTITVKAG